MTAAFLAACLACGFALVASIDFFFGAGHVGILLLPGAVVLLWWAKQRAKQQ